MYKAGTGLVEDFYLLYKAGSTGLIEDLRAYCRPCEADDAF